MVSGGEATHIPILCFRRGLLFSFTHSQIFLLRSNCVGCAHLSVTVYVACQCSLHVPCPPSRVSVCM